MSQRVPSDVMSQRIPPRTKTVLETAAALDVSRRTVERYIAGDKLTAYKTHTGRVAVDEESIEALLAPTRISAPADSAPEAESSAERAS